MKARETDTVIRPGQPPISTGPQAVGDPPVITGINPTHGPAGTYVEIDGRNFDTVIGVTFGPLGASFKNDSSSVVHATVPTGLTGQSAVVVTTEPLGQILISNPYPFTIDPTMIVFGGFEPGHGVTGTKVTITGTGLSGVKTVSFNGVQASFSPVSDTKLTATVPDDATTGKISLSDGTSAAVYSAAAFIVDPTPPSIDGFNPPAGTVGQQVMIQGHHLSKVTAVFFNKVAGVIVRTGMNAPVPNQQFPAIVPAGATTGPVHVESPNGGATSQQDFIVIQTPQLDSVSPMSARAGTKVTLAGRHLGELTSVTVNGQAAKFSEKSEKSVKVTIPSVAPGTATIVVANAAGQAQIGFTVTA